MKSIAGAERMERDTFRLTLASRDEGSSTARHYEKHMYVPHSLSEIARTWQQWVHIMISPHQNANNTGAPAEA